MKKYMFEYEACIHAKFSVQVLAETEEEAKSKFEDKDFDVVDMTRLGTTHNFSNETIVTNTPQAMSLKKEDLETCHRQI